MDDSNILRVQPRFKIGDLVYVVTDPDQRQMMISGIIVRKTTMTYMVSFVDIEHEYESFQLTADRRII